MSGFPLPPFGGHQPFPSHLLSDQMSAPSAESTYHPYGLGHFPIPSPHHFSPNGTNLPGNPQIPGLSAFANGMPPMPQDFSMLGSNPASYYTPNADAQPSVSPSYQALHPNSRLSNSGATSTRVDSFETSVGGAGTGHDNSQDAMELDSREEGELSNGEMELDVTSSKKRQHNPPFVQGSPPVENYPNADDNHNGQWNNHDKVLPAGQQPLIAQTKTIITGSSNNDNTDQSAVYDGHSTSSTPSQSRDGRSLTQLRMQAQGALLNLAPHNIRYRELVNEGVDPIILKALYEGIGLKVTAIQPADMPAAAVQAQKHSNLDNSTAPAPPSGTDQGDAIGVHSMTAKPVSRPVVSPESSGNKPLERKDLIARMLAAKAGKTGSAQKETPSTTLAQKALSSSKENVALPRPAPSRIEHSQTSEDTPAREKNKAQTELARQRMEQLRKKGLSIAPSQLAIESSVSPSAAASTSTPVVQPQITTPRETGGFQHISMTHPLPERPPDSDVTTSTRIPGLFMTGNEQTVSETTSAANNRQFTTLGTSSSAVRIPRKRPRASDFTDDNEEPSHKHPVPEQRMSNSDHRVVIDISEDESMYDVDTGSTVNGRLGEGKDALKSPRAALSTNRGMPFSDIPVRPTHSYRSASSGSLPQLAGKGRDEENIRSEIMVMRQRIAELEKRRDAKRAAQAQSYNTPSQSVLSSTTATPRAPHGEKQFLVTSVPQPPAQENQGTSISTQFGVAPKLVPAESSTQNLEKQSRSPSSRSWSSLEPRKAEELRQKFLRKKEIETGLPALEAELVRSEARLAQFREEEKRLLAEIAKGKAGRQRLIAELEELGVETEGLTLEELQLTKDRLVSEAELKERISDLENVEKPVNLSESTSQVVNIHESDFPPRPTQPDTISDAPTVPRTSQEAIDAAAQTTNPQQTASQDREGSIDSSCSSSAMDESMGSSEGDEDDVDEDELPAIQSETESPGSAPVNRSEPTMELPKVDDVETMSTGERSAPLDDYEPPEPDIASHSDSPFSSSSGLEETFPLQPGAPDVQQMPLDQKIETLTITDQGSPKEIPIANSKETSENASHFTPYISPLRLFKAYRYHPNFVNDVKGGFRSITFSNNIDPTNTLCAFEGAGGTCNDKSCRSQHFRDMTLSDDKILVEMGSLREGKTPAEREEYVTGLKQIINDMRRDKVKDFSTVATEIAAYRRRFLKDPSRVLAL